MEMLQGIKDWQIATSEIELDVNWKNSDPSSGLIIIQVKDVSGKKHVEYEVEEKCLFEMMVMFKIFGFNLMPFLTFLRVEFEARFG